MLQMPAIARHTVLVRSGCLLIACAVTALSQAALPPRLEFDVAAIREVPHSKGKFKIQEPELSLAGSRFSLAGSLRTLIETAWNLRQSQISGPAWLDANAFRIDAQATPGATDEQLRLMCQYLLRDRFGLTFHLERRQQPAYLLVRGKAGPTLTASTATGASIIKSKPGRIASASASMPGLADALSRQLGRPVLDETELSGEFRIVLNWTPIGQDAPSAKVRKAQKSQKDFPSLFTAIQEQLGLRLESQRAVVDTLIVDHINRTPTDN